MDSDWDHLHREIQIGDHVDQRPNQFAKAVIKFKQYVQTMHNIGVSVDIFFGHINDTPSHDKGIDDLLCNTLKGREEVLRKEIDTVMHTHDGKGQFLDIHKITSKTDFQIKDFWLLNDRDGFFERHKEELLQIPNFRFAKINYRIEDGKLVQASRYSSERDFWVIGAMIRERKRSISITSKPYSSFQLMASTAFILPTWRSINISLFASTTESSICQVQPKFAISCTITRYKLVRIAT